MTSETRTFDIDCMEGYTLRIVHDWLTIVNSKVFEMLDLLAEKVNFSVSAEKLAKKTSICTTRNPSREEFDEINFRFEEMFMLEINVTSSAKKFPNEQMKEDFRETIILFEGDTESTYGIKESLNFMTKLDAISSP
jgi:hypothetical protein